MPPGPVLKFGAVSLRSSRVRTRSEEHTSELQSRPHLVCRLLLEKKKPVDPGGGRWRDRRRDHASVPPLARKGLPAQHFFFNDTATTEIYTLSLHVALPISSTSASTRWVRPSRRCRSRWRWTRARSPDRKSTRLNSSHVRISYAVFCLKKKKSTTVAVACCSRSTTKPESLG